MVMMSYVICQWEDGIDSDTTCQSYEYEARASIAMVWG